jgi:hypothetical protein
VGDGAGNPGYATLRPTSDVSGYKGIAVAGGSFPAYDDLSDSSDSTYMNATAGYPNSWYAAGMADLAVVVDGTAKRVRALRCRARIGRQSADAGHWQKASLTVRTTTPTVSPSSPRDVCQTASVGPLAFTGAWRTADPFGNAWTQASVNACQMETYGYANQVGSTSATSFLRFYEWYLDVDIRERPAITGTPSVTGAGTTRPQVDFVYAPNPDGDVQARAQVKVFTAAQYGATGFSADTSASFWDSGALATASTSVKVARDLQNGTTYKMYCRAAQLLNGAVWWTAWVPSGAFTVSLGPPANPTLTVTADDAGQRAVLQVGAAQSMLLADDADFEGGLSNWGTFGNCAGAQSATFAASGTKSMRLTATAAADMTAAITGNLGPIVAGRQYTFYAQSRAGTIARSFRVEVDWKDAAGTTIGATAQGSTLANSTSNFLATSFLTQNAPAGARTCIFRVRVLAPAAAEQHYFDKMGWWPGPSQVWTSGGQQLVCTVLLETMDAAASSLNLLPNQIATCGMHLESTAGFTDRVSSGGVVVDDSTAAQGEGGIRWTTGLAGSFLDIGFPVGVVDEVYAFPVVPAKQYTFSIWLKAGVSFSSKLFLNFCDQAGAEISNANAAMTVTTGYVKYQVSGTAPAGAMWAKAGVENTANVVGAFVYLSNAKLREGTSDPDGWVPGQLEDRAWRVYPGWQDRNLNSDEYQEDFVYDYLLPRGRPRLYRVRVVNSVTGTAVGSAAYAYGAAEITNAGGWWVVDPFHPWLSLRVTTPQLSLDTAESVQAFQLLGRDRPVVLSDEVYGEDGQVTFTTKTRDEWLRLRALTREQHALLLRSPFSDEQWWVRFVERGREFTEGPDVDTPVRQFTCKYYEVEAPA